MKTVRWGALIASSMIILSSCSSTSSLSRKDACITLAKELQSFYNSPGSFADGANALSLGLQILQTDVDEELQKDLIVYLDLIEKVDSTITTNAAFQALVEQKHVDALNGFKAKCLAEGIKID